MNQDTFKNLPGRFIWALLVLWMGLASCGRDRFVHRWNDRVLATGKLVDQGRLDVAEQRYLKLLETAPDAEDRRDILNELGAISEERGEWRVAIARYEEVWKEPRDDEAGAHALYHTATIVGRELGEVDRGRELLRKTATRYPKSVSAEFAVRDLAAQYRDSGDYDAMVRALDELYDEVEQTPVGDNILFTVAQTLQLDAGDEDAALGYYRRLYRTYPDGGLTDDALWEAAMIYRRRQQWRSANKLFAKLADNVETSWFVGSYNSPWANDARFELGLIHMLYLDDYDRAMGHFERYLEDFPTSTDVDDAAWNIVQLHRLRGDDERYLEAMADFVEEYPESRFVRLAERRLAEVSPK